MVHTEQASEAGPDGPTAHTRGPWKVSDRVARIASNHDRYLVIVSPGIRWVSLVMEGSPQCEEDARLIAAAPDLLEAAQKVLAQSGSNPQPEKAAQSYRGGFDVGYALASAHAAQFVRAAIAKATGQ